MGESIDQLIKKKNQPPPYLFIFLLITIIFIVALVIFNDRFSKPTNSELPTPTPTPKLVNKAQPTRKIITNERIITAETVLENCKIKVKTNKEEFLITRNPSISSKCFLTTANHLSQSKIYLVYEDFSNGIDEMVSLYSIEEGKNFPLDIYGSSEIFDMLFLPDDKLAVLHGLKGDFKGQYITVYDLPLLFKDYPANVNPQYKTFTNLSLTSKSITLPNISKDYTNLQYVNNKLEAVSKIGKAETTKDYSLSQFLPSEVTQRTVRLYIFNKSLDQGSCPAQPKGYIEREIIRTDNPIKDTISLLVKGELTSEEKGNGFYSDYPISGFSLKNTNLKDGILTLEFPVIPSFTSGGSCRVTSLAGQIIETAKQFSEVKEVKFLPSEIFQP